MKLKGFTHRLRGYSRDAACLPTSNTIRLRSSHTGSKVGVMLKVFTHWQQSEGDATGFHPNYGAGDVQSLHAQATKSV